MKLGTQLKGLLRAEQEGKEIVSDTAEWGQERQIARCRGSVFVAEILKTRTDSTLAGPGRGENGRGLAVGEGRLGPSGPLFSFWSLPLM